MGSDDTGIVPLAHLGFKLIRGDAIAAHCIGSRLLPKEIAEIFKATALTKIGLCYNNAIGVSLTDLDFGLIDRGAITAHRVGSHLLTGFDASKG